MAFALLGVAACDADALLSGHLTATLTATRNLVAIGLLLPVICITVARSLMERAARRRHGKAVEGRAVRSLRKALSRKAEVRSGIRTRYGDLDAYVKMPSGSWAVEIKAHREVYLDDGRIFLRGKSHADPNEFVRQAWRNAEATLAEPVLWFPDAPRCASSFVGGVHVVTGPAPYLARVCGMRTGWFA